MAAQGGKKSGKSGKPESPMAPAAAASLGPVIYRAGEKVSVFYRCGENDSYMPVSSYAQCLKTPRVGQTHGWVPAIVVDDFDSSSQGAKDVRVR